MIFYHYTTIYAVAGIRALGVLKPTPPNQFAPPWLSITTDTDSVGHGLPDGRALGADDSTVLACEYINGIAHCFDHTQCRVVLDLDEGSEKLVRAIEYHSRADLINLNIAAYAPTRLDISSAEIQSIHFDILSGLKLPKTHFWWYWKDPVLLVDIVRFEIRNDQGQYVLMP